MSLPMADSESDIRNGLPRTYVDNERTDGEEWSPTRDTSSSVTRAPTYGISPFSEAVEQFADAIELGHKRTRVVRSGDRIEIPGWVRKAVHARDGWRCRWCATRVPGFQSFTSTLWLELDHIVPWSAGGSDRSDNLRTLCNDCNEGRSNYVSDSHVRVTPVGWCDRCARSSSPHPPVLVFCGTCEMTRPATAPGRVA